VDLYPFAKSLHEQHLREAEKNRRYRMLAQESFPLKQRILLRLGDLLIAYGNRLKANPALNGQAHRPVNRFKLKGIQ
jgi:hypothetical protein